MSVPVIADKESPTIIVTNADEIADATCDAETETRIESSLSSPDVEEEKVFASRSIGVTQLTCRSLSLQTQDYLRQISSYIPGSTLPVFLRSKVNLELRRLSVDHINIALFGSPGCGKSALMNTIYLVMNGNYVEYSAERKFSQSTTSVTDTRLELRVTETVSVLDNRGCDWLPHSWKEISRQCAGYRDAGQFVPRDWNASLCQKIKDAVVCCRQRKLLRNRVHCPILVLSLQETFNRRKVKSCLDLLKESCGCWPVVALTNLDRVKLKSEEAYNLRMELENLNCARVFPLACNTHARYQANEPTYSNIVEMLLNCCLEADQTLARMVSMCERKPCC